MDELSGVGTCRPGAYTSILMQNSNTGVPIWNSSTSWWGINYPAHCIFVLLCTPTLLTSPPCPCNWDELQGTGDKPAKERYCTNRVQGRLCIAHTILGYQLP